MELRNLSQVTAMGVAMTLVMGQTAALAAPAAARPAPAAVIGTAVSAGNFVMNDRVMVGSGSVRNGAALATQGAGSTLHLSGGVRLDLAPNSRGQIYQDRLVLEAGDRHRWRFLRVAPAPTHTVAVACRDLPSVPQGFCVTADD